MFCVDSVENFFEIRSAEMCFRLQAGEDAPAGHALEVLLTNILQTKETKVNRDMESEMLAQKNQVILMKAGRICSGVPRFEKWYGPTLWVDIRMRV